MDRYNHIWEASTVDGRGICSICESVEGSLAALRECQEVQLQSAADKQNETQEPNKTEGE